MKLSVILFLISFSITSYSQEDNFEKSKEILTKRLKRKIEMTQKALDCVKNSTDEKSLRVCRKKAKKHMRKVKERRQKAD